jgi:hypothetical protein
MYNYSHNNNNNNNSNNSNNNSNNNSYIPPIHCQMFESLVEIPCHRASYYSNA